MPCPPALFCCLSFKTLFEYFLFATPAFGLRFRAPFFSFLMHCVPFCFSSSVTLIFPLFPSAFFTFRGFSAFSGPPFLTPWLFFPPLPLGPFLLPLWVAVFFFLFFSTFFFTSFSFLPAVASFFLTPVRSIFQVSFHFAPFSGNHVHPNLGVPPPSCGPTLGHIPALFLFRRFVFSAPVLFFEGLTSFSFWRP